MALIQRAIWVVLLLFAAGPAQAQDPLVQTRTLAAKVKIHEWLPPGFGQDKKQWPLILFSHGLDGCGTQSKFLTEALAEHGYVVAAPDHADATCGHRGAGRAKMQQPFHQPEDWSDQTHKNRADDMGYTLDYVLKDPATGPFIDGKRIGLAGHSLGGYTVMGIAGAWPSWRDKRYKAVLALSPYATPFTAHDTLKDIGIPIMYQGGTRDSGITPDISKQGGIYDRSPSPKYFVEFTRTGHFGFSNLVGNRHDAMNDYALAFFDKYLTGRDDGLLSAKAGDGVAEYRANP